MNAPIPSRLRRAFAAPQPDQSGEGWYKIHNAAPKTADVYLYDEIGIWGITAQAFASEVAALNVDTINLRINSPGGDVYDGLAILNVLRDHKAKVNVTVDGIAASAASFIAMAGDTVTMSRNSELMIHDAWGIAMGGPKVMADMATRLDSISDNIASIYAEHAGGEAADWRASMQAETWYSAQEAVDAGLADKVADPKGSDDSPAKDRFDLSVFNYAGRAKAPTPRTETPAAAPAGGSTETPEEGSDPVAFSDETIATLRQKLGVTTDADEATILAALDTLTERPKAAVVDTLPEGVVTIDKAQLDELRDKADMGVKALAAQEKAHRESIVDAAVQDGRIAPARRDHWLASLEADTGAAETLNSLEKGLVPVSEKGYVAGSPDATVEDDSYPSNWKR